MEKRFLQTLGVLTALVIAVLLIYNVLKPDFAMERGPRVGEWFQGDYLIAVETGSKEWERDMNIHIHAREKALQRLPKGSPKYNKTLQDIDSLKLRLKNHK